MHKINVSAVTANQESQIKDDLKFELPCGNNLKKFKNFLNTSKIQQHKYLLGNDHVVLFFTRKLNGFLGDPDYIFYQTDTRLIHT